MSCVYAMSDIHGFLQAFEEFLSLLIDAWYNAFKNSGKRGAMEWDWQSLREKGTKR